MLKNIAPILIGFALVSVAYAQEFSRDSIPQTLDAVKELGQTSLSETEGLFKIDTREGLPCMGYVQYNYENNGSYEIVEYACVLQEVRRDYVNAPMRIASSTDIGGIDL